MALGIGAWWWSATTTHSPLVPTSSNSIASPAAPHAETPSDRIILPIASEVVLNAPEGLPADDLATLDLLISTYRRSMGENPIGENEEITAALLGRNAKHLGFLPEQGSFLNASGQLVDRWGTPYFFHAMAADRLEIRSAGPDREWWTKDDLTLSP